jgi:thioredoxin reductase
MESGSSGTLPDMSRYDVVVVGGGAAGLSAALVLVRARRTVLVVDSGTPRNAPAQHMHGFLSRDGMPPRELLTIGRDEITGYGGRITFDAVVRVQPIGPDGFEVHLSDGTSVSTRRLLVATGLRDELPAVKGLQERWARDVLHCPYCHGWEVRDRPLGVLADGSPESVQYAHIVRQWTDDLVLFVPRDILSANQRVSLAARSVTVIEGSPEQVLVEDDRLIGV